MSETYRDIKDKTIEWCKKLKESGIYTKQDYQSCLNSFVELQSGELPPDMEPPKSGNEFSYSLYDRKNNYIQRKLIDTKTNKIMISTVNKLFLLPKEDGTVSIINKENIVNLKDVEWTIIPHKEEEYLFKSRFGFYLTSDQNKKVHADRKDIGPNSLWNIRKNNGIVNILSVEFEDNKLTANNPPIISGGKMRTHDWKITNVLTAEEQLIKTFDPSEIHAKKDSLVTRLEELLKEKYEIIIEWQNVIDLMQSISNKYNVIGNAAFHNMNKINSDFSKKSKEIRNWNVTKSDKNKPSLNNNSNIYLSDTKSGEDITSKEDITSEKYSLNKELNKKNKGIKEDREKAALSERSHIVDDELNRYNTYMNKFEDGLTIKDSKNFRPFTTDEIVEQHMYVKNYKEVKMQELLSDKDKLKDRYSRIVLEYRKLDKETLEWVKQLKRDIATKEENIKQNNIRLNRQGVNLNDIDNKNKTLDQKNSKVKKLEKIFQINSEKKQYMQKLNMYYYYANIAFIIVAVGFSMYFIRMFLLSL